MSHNGNVKNDIREVYASRNILRSLVSKDLFGRYRNSALGFAWHFVTPLVMLAVYYVVFTEIRSSPIPDFWVYLASSIFPFTFMTSNLSGGAGCVTGNAGMVKKMYFPREILVLAHVISNFIIMLLGYIAALVIIVISGFPLNPMSLAMLPPILLLIAAFTAGYVFLFSSLNVYIRDIQYILSSFTMVIFFMTPMYFISGDVSGILSKLIWINPFTYYVEALHSIVYFGEIPGLKILLMCIILPIVSLTMGLAVFRRLRRGFAERL